MIRNLIFDWSGTLADDLGPVLQATNAIFRHFGRSEMALDEFRSTFRLPFSGFYAEHLPQATEEGLEVLYERFFAGLQDNVSLLPGAREILDFCHATQRRTFLLSTIKRNHFETQAVRLGVADDFDHAYVEILDKREKIRDLVHVHGLNPAETLFVGDMVHDMETARHGGVLDVAILTGFDPPEKLLASRPSIIVRNLGCLQNLLA